MISGCFFFSGTHFLFFGYHLFKCVADVLRRTFHIALFVVTINSGDVHRFTVTDHHFFQSARHFIDD